MDSISVRPFSTHRSNPAPRSSQVHHMIMDLVKILDSHMAYTEAGNGDCAVVFLHRNPTSSYLWRNVIPLVGPALLTRPGWRL